MPNLMTFADEIQGLFEEAILEGPQAQQVYCSHWGRHPYRGVDGGETLVVAAAQRV
jgi:hypothetical protein